MELTPDLMMARVLARRALGLEQVNEIEQKVSRDIDEARAKRIVELENRIFAKKHSVSDTYELEQKKKMVIDEYLAKFGYQQTAEGNWVTVEELERMKKEYEKF